jgi:patatin-like phospholipase/acyl hydrolase
MARQLIRKKVATPKRKTVKRETKKKFRILSIDGGGIRGILPGQILVALEEILGQRDHRHTARIADYFDMIVGTSTGGILVCCYLAPRAQGRRPKFSAQEAVNLYLDRGGDVFSLSIMQRIRSAGGYADETYNAQGLEDALGDYFGDLKLSDLLRPCLLTAYDIERRKAHFFRQHRARRLASADFLVRDAARATSAAPTYFEASHVQSQANESFALIDGGLFANNPALCGYAEARTLPKQPRAKDMVILSLGTGATQESYPYKSAKNWGRVQWIQPVLDIMMSGVAETVDYQLRQIYDAVQRPKQYLRIEPNLGDASPHMDDASPGNLNNLRLAGLAAANHYHDELKRFAELL